MGEKQRNLPIRTADRIKGDRAYHNISHEINSFLVANDYYHHYHHQQHLYPDNDLDASRVRGLTGSKESSFHRWGKSEPEEPACASV